MINNKVYYMYCTQSPLGNLYCNVDQHFYGELNKYSNNSKNIPMFRHIVVVHLSLKLQSFLTGIDCLMSAWYPPQLSIHHWRMTQNITKNFTDTGCLSHISIICSNSLSLWDSKNSSMSSWKLLCQSINHIGMTHGYTWLLQGGCQEQLCNISLSSPWTCELQIPHLSEGFSSP